MQIAETQRSFTLNEQFISSHSGYITLLTLFKPKFAFSQSSFIFAQPPLQKNILT